MWNELMDPIQKYMTLSAQERRRVLHEDYVDNLLKVPDAAGGRLERLVHDLIDFTSRLSGFIQVVSGQEIPVNRLRENDLFFCVDICSEELDRLSDLFPFECRGLWLAMRGAIRAIHDCSAMRYNVSTLIHLLYLGAIELGRLMVSSPLTRMTAQDQALADKILSRQQDSTHPLSKRITSELSLELHRQQRDA